MQTCKPTFRDKCLIPIAEKFRERERQGITETGQFSDTTQKKNTDKTNK